MYRILRKHQMLKKGWHPLTKPDWSSDMTAGKTCSSLTASTLARILKSTFKSDIGLYDTHSVGSFPFFAIKVIDASEVGSLPCIKDSEKTEWSRATSCGAREKTFYREAIWSRGLPCKEKIAALISPLEIYASNVSLRVPASSGNSKLLRTLVISEWSMGDSRK